MLKGWLLSSKMSSKCLADNIKTITWSKNCVNELKVPEKFEYDDSYKTSNNGKTTAHIGHDG